MSNEVFKRVPKKIIFEQPIIVDSKEITEVTMRVPKVSDMFAVDHLESQIDREIALISNLTGIPMTVDDVENWDVAEYMALQSTLKGLQVSKAKIL